jgi:iron complex outermembrane receptor protein
VQRLFKALQPKASLSYFFEPDKMVYISAGRGFRSGGFNQQSTLFNREYNAETADTYEAGTKLSLADRRVQLNAAAFYTTQRNVQVYRFDATTGAQGILTIDKAHHYGIEGDLSARIGGGFRFNLGGSLINSRIDDYDGTSLYVGNKLPHVNGFQYNAGLEYDTKVSQTVSATARVDLSSFGDLYWFIDNAAKQNQVRLVNARLILSKAPFSLTLAAENLSNRRYDTDYFSSFFAGTPTDVGYPNEPRQVTAKLAVKF